MKKLKLAAILMVSPMAMYFYAGMTFWNGLMHAAVGSWLTLLDFASVACFLFFANHGMAVTINKCIGVGRALGGLEIMASVEKHLDKLVNEQKQQDDALGKN